METSMLSCEQWAEQTFGAVQLRDPRRTRRLQQVAAALARRPSGSLARALGCWKELKGAYRLLNTPQVTFEQVLTPHWQQVRAHCATPGEYLLIEDTTLLDFSSHPQLQGIGRIGDDQGRGLNLHTTLAVRVARWGEAGPDLSLLGLAGQALWVRPEALVRGTARKGYEPKKRRLTRARESERWGQVLAELHAAPPGNQRIYLADRESDIYELFARCRAAGCEFVVRACQNRALLENPKALFAAVAEPGELGRYHLHLRARPGAAARTATVAVRALEVKLRPPYRPGGAPPAQTLVVVEAREIHPPAPEQAICWRLLTSLPGTTYEQARRVIQLYACRWLIEEYHKALKTGVGIENSQLEEAERIEALLGILSLVAV